MHKKLQIKFCKNVIIIINTNDNTNDIILFIIGNI